MTGLQTDIKRGIPYRTLFLHGKARVTSAKERTAKRIMIHAGWLRSFSDVTRAFRWRNSVRYGMPL